jgi:hypothetical protein
MARTSVARAALRGATLQQSTRGFVVRESLSTATIGNHCAIRVDHRHDEQYWHFFALQSGQVTRFVETLMMTESIEFERWRLLGPSQRAHISTIGGAVTGPFSRLWSLLAASLNAKVGSLGATGFGCIIFHRAFLLPTTP